MESNTGWTVFGVIAVVCMLAAIGGCQISEVKRSTNYTEAGYSQKTVPTEYRTVWVKE